MAFEPPLQHLSQITFSRADLLLPQPIQRRFAKYADSGPIVSISPRRLVPFTKKIKKKAYEGARSDVDHPTVSIESLLDGSNDQAASSAPTSDRWATSQIEPPRKSKSPVKTSLAAKAEKDGLFAAQGVSISIPERARALSDAKPGVRFMVSSELEGDSLLDEVNKISLETVGEGFEAKGKDKGDAKAVEVSDSLVKADDRRLIPRRHCQVQREAWAPRQMARRHHGRTPQGTIITITSDPSGHRLHQKPHGPKAATSVLWSQAKLQLPCILLSTRPHPPILLHHNLYHPP